MTSPTIERRIAQLVNEGILSPESGDWFRVHDASKIPTEVTTQVEALDDGRIRFDPSIQQGE